MLQKEIFQVNHKRDIKQLFNNISKNILYRILRHQYYINIPYRKI